MSEEDAVRVLMRNGSGGAGMSLQAALVDHLRNQSRWRQQKAQEYPDDDRNAHSARALAEAADYVEQLPNDDERLQRLGRVGWYDGGVFHPGEEGQHVVSRWGFDRSIAKQPISYHPEGLLDGLIAACERDQAAWERENAEDESPL